MAVKPQSMGFFIIAGSLRETFLAVYFRFLIKCNTLQSSLAMVAHEALGMET